MTFGEMGFYEWTIAISVVIGALGILSTAASVLNSEWRHKDVYNSLLRIERELASISGYTDGAWSGKLRHQEFLIQQIGPKMERIGEAVRSIEWVMNNRQGS